MRRKMRKGRAPRGYTEAQRAIDRGIEAKTRTSFDPEQEGILRGLGYLR